MRRIVALVVLGLVLALLVIAQFVLPGIAEQRLRDRLAHSGRVISVQVSAFPAIELLWHHADKVVVRLASYRSSPGHLSGTLDQVTDVGSLDASAGELDTGLVTLHDATLRKRGNALTGTARVTEADLRSAIPILQDVRPVASGGGSLTLRGTGTVFGVTASVDATVSAQNGRLVVTPDVPFGGFATLTLFDNPHVSVQSVGATSTADGLALSATAKVH